MIRRRPEGSPTLRTSPGNGQAFDGCPQIVDPVELLPRQVEIRAAEMPVGRRRQVNRPAQIELLDDRQGPQIKGFEHRPGEHLVAQAAGTERADRDGNRTGHPNRIRYLDLAPVRKSAATMCFAT